MNRRSQQKLVQKVFINRKICTTHFSMNGWSFNSMGNGKVRVTVTFKDIDKIEASGACNVKANNTIKEKKLKIDLSGGNG